MAYSNSYASRQWPALQTSSWPDSDMGWGTSTVTDGTSPESSSSSSTGSPMDSQGLWEPVELANSNPSSHTVGSHAQQIPPNIPSAVDPNYFPNYSEAPATTYLPTAIDDSYPFYFGDMNGYDLGAMSSPPLASIENTLEDRETKYEMLPEREKEQTSGRRKTSKVKRQLQNRLAQRAFRERQARAQEELQQKVRNLKTQYATLETMYMQLREDHERCGQGAGNRSDFSCRSS